MKIIALFFALFTALTAIPAEKPAENPADLIPVTAIVIDCNRRDDIVTVEDAGGNLWQFTGIEDYEPGDLVSMILDGKNTPIIYDDEIVTVRYAGWPEYFANCSTASYAVKTEKPEGEETR